MGENFPDADALLLRSASIHEMIFPASLKAIARAGAGVNNIPLDICTDKGIVVFNTPGANANAVKELVICSLFLASRKITESVLWTKNYKGESLHADIEKNKSLFKGPEILGKTLGVIGLGAIGMQVANAAQALGMHVMGFDPYISVDSAWQLSKNVQKADSLEQILSQADYISLHLPLLENTKGFINQDRLQHMKDGVRILNFARGALVDEKDMRHALETKKVAIYITDFPGEEMMHTENVISIPHLGASTPESEENCAVMAVDQIRDFLENGNIRNSVNFPEAVLPRNGGVRLTVINRNIPKMVSKITKVLAKADVNILVMYNKHKDNVAYNIIDLEQPLNSKDLEQIKNIEGVLSVRIIS